MFPARWRAARRRRQRDRLRTADDFCEALLRNTLFTGRRSARRPSPHSRDRQFRLIRPLVFVTENITRAYAEARGVPVVPCGCSQRTGAMRHNLRALQER